MQLTKASLRLVLLPCCLTQLYALAPMSCPAGAPLGRFDLTVSAPGAKAPRPVESMNRVLPNYTISYRPEHLDTLDKKKARVALLLAPSEGSKIVVTDPKPAAEPIDWTVGSRTQIVSLVWSPAGLDKGKVTHLVAKDQELIGQLADYAAKVQETQGLLAAITAQQAMDPTQNIGAAVAGFASTYPNAPKLDRNAPTNAQMLTLINGVNPALSAYDPLAANPQQRAAQTAGLAAAVAGLFFGNGVGLAAGSGAVLVNMHSLLFPNTEFRSALAQTSTESPNMLNLCGNKAPSASRTQLAFLWAVRVPDSTAPDIDLTKTEHVPIGAKYTIPIEVKGVKESKLAARADHWSLAPSDGSSPVPVAVKISADAKSAELDLSDPKLKPGKWTLAAKWDWDQLQVHGDIELHSFSSFDRVRLAPESQDHLTPSADKQIVSLVGDDFEFVKKLSYKKAGDPFAQLMTLPFRLPEQNGQGPTSRLETQLDPKSMEAGDYLFLIAQSDDKPHEVPFKVLPGTPAISNLPLIAHTDTNPQVFELQGSNLDRIVGFATYDPAVSGVTMEGTGKLIVTLSASAAAGKQVTLNMTVQDVAEPIVLTDAIRIAGPRPAITSVRKSNGGDGGISIAPDEIPEGESATFAIRIANANTVNGVSISCNGGKSVELKTGETNETGRLRQESPDSLFLSLNPQRIGQPGCAMQVSLLTPDGPSNPQSLGKIVRLPRIEGFQLTDEKAGDNGYVAVLKGKDLETIDKAGWDGQSGITVDAIPAPITGESNQESLRVALPWPAPSPHAPLYIWLRGESAGRKTSSRY